MQFYRRNLPHIQKDHTPHFITFVTKSRWTLPDWARDIVLSSCLHDHRIRYELYVAVVMQDHAHLILTPCVNEQKHEIFAISEIMRTIKSASAHIICRRLGHVGPIWQEESFDHILRSSESLDAKINYVLQNPVRRGFVDDWQAYRWAWQRQAPELAPMRRAVNISNPDAV
jgi:REP element-mobilizing transposase RayT